MILASGDARILRRYSPALFLSLQSMTMGRVSASRIAILLAAAAACCAQTVPANRQEFTRQLVAAAVERTHHSVRYVSEYLRIPYPGGDVPADTGVCTDEIIRSYRAVGVDLQKEVHEDMVQNFAAYPNKHRWCFPMPIRILTTVACQT